MEDSLMDNSLNGPHLVSPLEFSLDYDNYLSAKKLHLNQRILFSYNGCTIGLTQKHIEVLRFVAKGFSNVKIAKCLEMRESSVKLLIYRLMRSLEKELNESVDRFYLIIIAQQLGLDD